jgi:hypothetical protein
VTGEFEDLGSDGREDNIKMDHEYSRTVLTVLVWLRMGTNVNTGMNISVLE